MSSPRIPSQESPLDPVRLYRDYAGLRALIIRKVGDPEVGADIFHDAIVTTLQKLQDGDISQPELIGGFIYRVALNHLRNHRRKDKSDRSSDLELGNLADPVGVRAETDTQQGQWMAVAREVLNSLPTARDREVLVRFYLDEEDKDAICRSLGLSDEHFARVIFRARNRFRGLLERSGYHKTDLLTLVLWMVSLYAIVMPLNHDGGV